MWRTPSVSLKGCRYFGGHCGFAFNPRTASKDAYLYVQDSITLIVRYERTSGLLGLSRRYKTYPYNERSTCVRLSSFFEKTLERLFDRRKVTGHKRSFMYVQMHDKEMMEPLICETAFWYMHVVHLKWEFHDLKYFSLLYIQVIPGLYDHS
jgi:hypothetical protein